MSNTTPVYKNHEWEKEYAPKITRTHVILASLLYAAWMIFLAIIAIHRWFGDLQ